MNKKKLETMTLKEMLKISDAWTTVSRAASLEGVTRGRIYQWVWAGKRTAVNFDGIILVLPAPRRRKVNSSGRPRISD